MQVVGAIVFARALIHTCPRRCDERKYIDR